MMHGFDEEDRDNIWKVLLHAIAEDRCVPFLGAGACYGSLPLGAEIARKWADEYKYPFSDRDNLLSVAQFLAVQYDPVFPKSQILAEIRAGSTPDFKESDEPHGVLAGLPLSLYLTTNYDDFLYRALSANPFRDPIRETCRWNELLEKDPPTLTAGWDPHPARPVVFHLHGHTRPESIVLTEDDYLRFLANMGRGDTLPPLVEKALARATCLFIGYRLSDWNFRILFEGLRRSLRSLNVAVLLPPGETDEQRQAARNYLERYYRSTLDLRVYWGTAREFSRELSDRWKEFQQR